MLRMKSRVIHRRHSRAGGNPATLPFNADKTLGPRLRGDDVSASDHFEVC